MCVCETLAIYAKQYALQMFTSVVDKGVANFDYGKSILHIARYLVATVAIIWIWGFMMQGLMWIVAEFAHKNCKFDYKSLQQVLTVKLHPKCI